ncbi:HAMP domain-containing histidine kinase [Kribbella pittospori]|uniref:histidine kinase n=1 Tax=Kribbella pittospori TaxID=722689 RepID=A0A4R0KQS3_9ACTN|nr:HAMP domain-containing sensor histidine kinase [Kribbella pittospori]TCC58265.1 HAMP domain-containing histidine kinase [Kribbella pittospori]
MRGPAADRLRRLRWWLTALFTVANTVGLLILAPIVIGLDAQRGTAEIDNKLTVVTAPALRLLDDSGALVFARVSKDPLNAHCPQFAILPGGAPAFKEHFSALNCTPVDRKVLDDLATQSVSTGSTLFADRKAQNGDPIRVNVAPFTNTSGQPVGAVVAWMDTDDQLTSHQRLVIVILAVCVLLIVAAALVSYWLSGRAIRPAMEALEQQESLLADTAHDLRSPIAGLRALAETAARDPEQRAELLPRTVRLAGRMGDIIDGLLVRARLASGVEQLAMQPVWLDQLVAGVVEDLPTDGARISLVSAPSMVRADPTLLQRAIGNLLDNAMRHGRTPGADQAIVTVTVADGRVTVADQGPGIDPTAGEDLFERFNSGGGSTGLGLPIVRWVALAHGGDLKVYNADEGGAIFEFHLPTSQ